MSNPKPEVGQVWMNPDTGDQRLIVRIDPTGGVWMPNEPNYDGLGHVTPEWWRKNGQRAQRVEQRPEVCMYGEDESTKTPRQLSGGRRLHRLHQQIEDTLAGEPTLSAATGRVMDLLADEIRQTRDDALSDGTEMGMCDVLASWAAALGVLPDDAGTFRLETLQTETKRLAGLDFQPIRRAIVPDMLTDALAKKLEQAMNLLRRVDGMEDQGTAGDVPVRDAVSAFLNDGLSKAGPGEVVTLDALRARMDTIVGSMSPAAQSRADLSAQLDMATRLLTEAEQVIRAQGLDAAAETIGVFLGATSFIQAGPGEALTLEHIQARLAAILADRAPAREPALLERARQLLHAAAQIIDAEGRMEDLVTRDAILAFLAAAH